MTRAFAAVLVLAALVAGHGVIIYYASAYAVASASAAAGLLILFALTHLGVFPALATYIRRLLSRHRSG
jgi:membrane protein YdbS with pleckstrin-like domain